jgi:hypothetical protein
MAEETLLSSPGIWEQEPPILRTVAAHCWNVRKPCCNPSFVVSLRRKRVLPQRQAEPLPRVDQGRGKLVGQCIVMKR